MFSDNKNGSSKLYITILLTFFGFLTLFVINDLIIVKLMKNSNSGKDAN